MERVETTAVVDGMGFAIRAWLSVAADGWRWTVAAEDGDYRVTGSRVWHSPAAATAGARAHLRRVFGEGEAAPTAAGGPAAEAVIDG